MKPVTRIFLIGAPIIVASAMYFGGGDDSGVLADHPPAFPGQSSKPTPGTPAPGASVTADKGEQARIAKLPAGLAAPDKKEIASRIVASAENSTLDWRSQYASIEDVGDGNGYTAGVIGFCSGTNDMLQLVTSYTSAHPDNPLAHYLPALRAVDGTDSHEGLDPGFTKARAEAAGSAAFREEQDRIRDKIYFDPAVQLAKMDGLSTLGQFMYYDAMVLHGPGLDSEGFYGIRTAAMKQVDPPAEGGSEKDYLNAFLDAGKSVMKTMPIASQRDSSRIDTAQRVFLRDGNMNLALPLTWKVYGETFQIRTL